jgi:hypothetical protein
LHNVYGIILIILGIGIIIFGDKRPKVEGGILLKMLTMPTIHAKFVKWGAGLVAIYFGVGFMLNLWKF